MYEKKPLYRKANKKVHAYFHTIPPGDYSKERNSKAMKNFEGAHQSMHGKQERGYDYTPLYKFLLKNVGQQWDDVFSEAVSRLDKKDPIFDMVTLHPREGELPVVRLGESAYYSRLTVDDEGILVKLDPNFTAADMGGPSYNRTDTFNGEPVEYDGSGQSGKSA